MPQLCITKFAITFNEEIVEVSDSDGTILTTIFLDPVKDLFMIPIVDNAKEQRVKVPTGIAGIIIKCIETDNDGVVCLVFLVYEQHTAANVYNITNIPVLISYLRACSGFPVIAI